MLERSSKRAKIFMHNFNSRVMVDISKMFRFYYYFKVIMTIFVTAKRLVEIGGIEPPQLPSQRAYCFPLYPQAPKIE
jgi:hypothetical protein